jgi:shikimate dehydrogenase
MSSNPPAVVVSLPARSVAEARSQARQAREAGAHVVELRLDRFPLEESARVAELFPTTLPHIATLRSKAEGGEGPDDPEIRLRLLVSFSHHPFRWIDVELARDLPAAEVLHRPGVQELIVSTHLLHGVDRHAWSQLVRCQVPAGALRKVVARASVGQTLRELVPDLPPRGEYSLTVATLGPSGALLRAWSRRLGLPMVFASLPTGLGGGAALPVEPSQIPVDRLRAFLDSPAETAPLFAIVGRPVAHSRSPDLHSRWMRAEKRPGLFVGLEFESDEELVDAIPALVDGGFRGLNVTHPFKATALRLATEVGPGASACGVANVLTFRDGEIAAENTDLAAILRRMEELRSTALWDGASVGVIGAGGAARATLAAARTLGADALVWSRREEAAETVSREFGARSVRATEEVRPSLVVHATTVGRGAASSETLPNLGWARPGVHVIDWVYGPDDPAIRIAAERSGATYEDGSRLLVYQAAASYGIWWGSEPSSDQVTQAVGRPA